MENSHLGSLTTERRNERSKRIHQAETIDMLKIMNDEDKTVAEAVQEVLPDVKTFPSTNPPDHKMHIFLNFQYIMAGI